MSEQCRIYPRLSIVNRKKIVPEAIIEDIIRIRDAAYDQGEYTAALKGNELLGKILRMFDPPPPPDATPAINNITILLNSLSLEQIEQLRTISASLAAAQHAQPLPAPTTLV